MKLWKDGKPTPLALAALCLAVLATVLLGGKGAEKSSASQQETRIAEVLEAMAGVGKVEVALFYGQEKSEIWGEEAAARPTGAVVVAQGGGNLTVRLSLIRAVRTLLSLPENAVDVFEMEEE